MLNYLIMKIAANAAAGLMGVLLPVTADSMSEKYYETVVDTAVIRNYVLDEVEDLREDNVEIKEISRVKYHDYDEKQDIYNFKFEVIFDGQKKIIEFHDVQEHELWNR